MDILDELAKSKFRSRFKLREKELEYIKEKGLDTIHSHACDFIRDRVAPAMVFRTLLKLVFAFLNRYDWLCV